MQLKTNASRFLLFLKLNQAFVSADAQSVIPTVLATESKKNCKAKDFPTIFNRNGDHRLHCGCYHRIRGGDEGRSRWTGYFYRSMGFSWHCVALNLSRVRVSVQGIGAG